MPVDTDLIQTIGQVIVGTVVSLLFVSFVFDALVTTGLIASVPFGKSIFRLIMFIVDNSLALLTVVALAVIAKANQEF